MNTDVGPESINNLVDFLSDQPNVDQLEAITSKAVDILESVKADLEDGSEDSDVAIAVENWLQDANNFLNTSDWSGVNEAIDQSPSDVREMLNDDAVEAGYDSAMEYLESKHESSRDFVVHFVKNICLYNAGYEFSSLQCLSDGSDSQSESNDDVLALFRGAAGN